MSKLTTQNTRYAINKAIKKAFELFSTKQFESAFKSFEHILSIAPKNKDAKIGILLCDSARDFPENAYSLFEYYQILLSSKISKQKAQRQILDILESVDRASFSLSDMFKGIEQKKIQELDGILYQDFLHSIKNRSGFKEAFEDIMFSTKIAFASPQEFYDFLEQLIDNGFIEIGLEYIESFKALKHTRFDPRLDTILKKALNAHNKKHNLS
ncbi:hypothetical protein [uncultured Helicobacter sp.]|uniref:hypothetical protein n=1 Tax=uncultured Helicobacter sp. TaxID=175537 RepID=UPI00374EEADC